MRDENVKEVISFPRGLNLMCVKSEGVLEGTRKDQCPICGAAEFGMIIILRYTKTPLTNWRLCVRNVYERIYANECNQGYSVFGSILYIVAM